MKLNKNHFFGLLAILALDVITKTVVETVVGYGNSLTLIPNFFWLSVLHNTGAAWSFLEGQRLLFLAIALVAVVAMIVIYLRTNDTQTLLKWALVFLIAGTFGNFMDRLMLGYVRDFLSFNVFGYMFPVFNVADMSLNLGVGLMILDALLEGRTHDGKH